jgi:hypothetical protein
VFSLASAPGDRLLLPCPGRAVCGIALQFGHPLQQMLGRRKALRNGAVRAKIPLSIAEMIRNDLDGTGYLEMLAATAAAVGREIEWM